MELLLYLLSGIVIALLIRWVDRHFSKHIFSKDSLILSRTIIRHPFLSPLLPMAFSFLLTVILSADNTSFYVYPGLVASFCIIWPKYYNPEILPIDIKINKPRLLLLFIWLTATFTVFSSVGGLFGQRFIMTDVYSAKPESNYITWLVIGVGLVAAKKYIHLK